MNRHPLRLTLLCPLLLAAVASAADTQPAPTTKPADKVITLTPEAAAELKEIIKLQKLNPAYLRVGVKADGKQFSYTLDLTETLPQPDDIQCEDHGIKILVDRKSAMYLKGTEIHFKNNPNARGFVFRNPNALEK